MRGFSLLEMIFVLGLVAVVTAFLFPNQKIFLRSFTAKSLQQNIIDEINFARAEALLKKTALILRISPRELIVIDKEAQKVLQHFPISLLNGNLQTHFAFGKKYLELTQLGCIPGSITYIEDQKVQWKIVINSTCRVRSSAMIKSTA